jgi:Domain of unknown function (DUF4351)
VQLRQEIAGLAVDKLQELAKVLLQFGSMVDLTEWLDHHKSWI